MYDMDLLAVDVETTYTKERSLKKMSIQAYLYHPETELIGIATAHSRDGTKWYPGGRGFAVPPGVTLVAYNAMFDSLALRRFGLLPPGTRWLDALALARYCLSNRLVRLRLADVADWLGGRKMEMPSFAGRSSVELSETDLRAVADYAMRDAELALRVASTLVRYVSDTELRQIDLTVRKMCEPQLLLDPHVLTDIVVSEEREVDEILAEAGVSAVDVRSRERFAALLRSHGVEPPTKVSARTGRTTLAMARTDGWLAELAESERPILRALARARLRLSSTIHRTRARKLLEACRHTPWLSVPLHYFGAHTGRFSGADGLNLQNLPRGSRLRSAIVAPPGHLVVAADLAQIEARLAAWVARQEDLLDAFARKEDVYCRFASRLFGRTVTKADEYERRIGKIAVLGLGYGMGATRFVDYAAQAGVTVTEDEARRIVGTWRELNRRIVQTWWQVDQWLTCRRPLHLPAVRSVGDKLDLPRYYLIYHDLRVDEDGTASFLMHGERVRTYGAKVFENIVQALARTVLTDAELRLADRGWRAALSAHDELVFVVPKERREEAEAVIVEEMTRQPEWALDAGEPYPIPLAVEIGVGETYGDCK